MIIQWIRSHFTIFDRILDVGPGLGTYSDLLRPFNYTQMNCIEIYEPYIEEFKLKQKYKTVFCGNVVTFPIQPNQYDLVIMGDVLEHLNVEDAQKLLQDFTHKVRGVIISVPFLYEQSAVGGNIYETHLQPDLTKEIMQQRYPYLKLEGVENFIGVYSWLKSNV